METGSLLTWRTNYKGYYARLIEDARGVKGGNVFSYILLEIDIRNIQTLFRLRAGHREDLWI